MNSLVLDDESFCNKVEVAFVSNRRLNLKPLKSTNMSERCASKRKITGPFQLTISSSGVVATHISALFPPVVLTTVLAKRFFGFVFGEREDHFPHVPD